MEEREIMRKRLLKLTSMVLAGTMLVSMATGCGSSNTTTETAATTETTDEVTASSTEETSTDGEAPVYIGSTIETGVTNASRITGIAGGGVAIVRANTQSTYDNHSAN